MSFNVKSIGGLIKTQSTQTWKLSVAFTVLFRMQGVEKPGPAIKSFAETKEAIADNKTMIDAIRGAWPYASKLYDCIMDDADKDAILALNTGDARDMVLTVMERHIAALGLPKAVGRGAYFAVIHHKDAAAVAIEAERNAKAIAAKADEEAATDEDGATDEKPVKTEEQVAGKTEMDVAREMLESVAAMGFSADTLASMANILATMAIEAEKAAELVAAEAEGAIASDEVTHKGVLPENVKASKAAWADKVAAGEAKQAA